MINRILIANRGEIAVRIIHTVKKMGLEVVSVYHSDEENTLHSKLANYSVCLGGGSLAETYLNIPKIISIAKDMQCDAIHPGYGFLSENFLFAKACEEKGIVFIGPESEVIRTMGSKSIAREIARKAGIPVLEDIPIDKINSTIPANIKFPVMIKAAMGGGGKGMKIVYNQEDFQQSLESAQREALTYFNDDLLLLEPYLENARHIEVQVLADNFGNVVHLFERECSIQRNHQKIIEEAPAVSITENLRQRLLASSVKLAREIGYTNAGTIEYLVSGEDFYFLEMNTRIQVEHPVTEAITGIDLVESQLLIAQNHPLPEGYKKKKAKGHSIEVRIYAENPFESFRPSSGTIEFLSFPSNIRIDTFLESGSNVSTHFDAMLAKLITYAETREEAINKMVDALYETAVHGIETNISYLSTILKNKQFTQNEITTGFLKTHHDTIQVEYQHKRNAIPSIVPISAFAYKNFIAINYGGLNLWQLTGSDLNFRNFHIYIDNKESVIKLRKLQGGGFIIHLEDVDYQIEILNENSNRISFKTDNKIFHGFFTKLKNKPWHIFEIENCRFSIISPQIRSMAGQFVLKESSLFEKGFNQIVSPLFGKVIDIKVKEDEFVKKGDILMTIESMKTENHILSPGDGIVKKIMVYKGLQVKENFELIKLNSPLQHEYTGN